jgi:hypothetical protein
MKKILPLIGISLIISVIIVLLIFQLYGKKGYQVQSTQGEKPLVSASPSDSPDPWVTQRPDDLDKKENFSGKVLALRFAEVNKLKSKIIKVDSELVKGMAFPADYNRIIEKNPKAKLALLEIDTKNREKSILRLVFYWSKKEEKCILFSQFFNKEIEVAKDPYPLPVNLKYCKKYYVNP